MKFHAKKFAAPPARGAYADPSGDAPNSAKPSLFKRLFGR
jgi:hypothetical protein